MTCSNHAEAIEDHAGRVGFGGCGDEFQRHADVDQVPIGPAHDHADAFQLGDERGRVFRVQLQRHANLIVVAEQAALPRQQFCRFHAAGFIGDEKIFVSRIERGVGEQLFQTRKLLRQLARIGRGGVNVILGGAASGASAQVGRARRVAWLQTPTPRPR